MKISYNWLKEYLNLDNITHEELFKKISLHVNEIESYKKLVDATNLVVGHIISCVNHPNSDHLHICQVNIGSKITQIVCGAPNCRENIKVIVALPGAVLPGDFKIKESKVRGEESNGMICSLQELGIEEKYIDKEFKDGIFIFNDSVEVGLNPLEVLSLDDYVIDLELTANRSDLMSIMGAAYDIGAAIKRNVFKVYPNLDNLLNSKTCINVENKTSKCSKYLTRIVENITIKSSPWWIKARLIASGIRPINNIVDITNYVMIELGQPLHAFDNDLVNSHIIVRDSFDGEELITLDNIKRTLSKDDIVICNKDNKAICVAGVMGGISTEVTDKTVNVLLESAIFDKMSVRKTSTKLGLKSESSSRFEKGINEENTIVALDYAAYLISHLGDSKKVSDVFGYNNKETIEKTVSISTLKINSILGTNLTDAEVSKIFDRLDFSYELNDSFLIHIPARRTDLECSSQDIVEEVIRMYGYDKLTPTICKTSSVGKLSLKQQITRNIRNLLASIGLNETITYSLQSKKTLNDFTIDSDTSVDLLMPLSVDKAVMRQSLIGGLIDVVKYNNARKINDLAIFEIGKKYTTTKETTNLALAITNNFNQSIWQKDVKKVDFFILKGIVEKLFDMLNIKVSFKANETLNKNFHNKQTALISINDQVIGVIAKLHPRYLKEHDLFDLYVCEINLDKVIENYQSSILYQPIVKYPSIVRDLAIVCNKDITYNQIESVIKQTAKKYLVNIEVFDLYKGLIETTNEISIGVKLTFQDSAKTLESVDIDKIINSILNRLDFHLKAKLR